MVGERLPLGPSCRSRRELLHEHLARLIDQYLGLEGARLLRILRRDRLVDFTPDHARSILFLRWLTYTRVKALVVTQSIGGFGKVRRQTTLAEQLANPARFEGLKPLV